MTPADELRRRAEKTQEALNGLYLKARRLHAAALQREIALAKIKAEIAAVETAPMKAHDDVNHG
jgi:uncharacterized coiled-coil DUF342 family protein